MANMVLVKKILGLVLTLFVVFGFVGVSRANAFICKCAWEFPVCGVDVDPSGNPSCRDQDNDTDCPEGLNTIGNLGCDQNGDGHGNACYDDPAACGGGDPGPTVTPVITPDPGVLQGYVRGKYRLMPGNTVINEDYFGGANSVQVFLDQYRYGSDFVIPYDVTDLEVRPGQSSDSYRFSSVYSPADWYFPQSIENYLFTARVRVPSGYSVGYTMCYNKSDGACAAHNVANGTKVPNRSSLVRFGRSEQQAMQSSTQENPYADIYWHFCKNVSPSTLSVDERSCESINDTSTFRWTMVPSALTYALRIDDTADDWRGDSDKNGACDARRVGNDYCIDGIPQSSGSSEIVYRLTEGLIPGHYYKVWLHALNQCNDAGTVSTQITVDVPSCTSPTPIPDPTGGPVYSCQNMTVWKNGVKLVEPLTGKILLNDQIEYKTYVTSSTPVRNMYFHVKIANQTVFTRQAFAYCSGAGDNVYDSSFSVLQNSYGKYNVKLTDVEFGPCHTR